MNDAWFRNRVWRPLLEKAEIRHIRVHDARHTYASLMLRRSVPIVYISKQLGHSSIQATVDLYAVTSSPVPTGTASKRSRRRSRRRKATGRNPAATRSRQQEGRFAVSS
jgi:integrase